MCCPFGPISIRPRLEVSLEHRLEDELERPLHHSVADRRNREDADFALVLAFPYVGDIANGRAPWLHGYYSASLLLRTQPPPSRLRPTSRFSPVIRPTLLRRFRVGTRRASPVARHVLVTVLSLPPRRGEHPYASVFGCSCRLRPPVEGSALGHTPLRGHTAFTFNTARGLIASPGETLSIGFSVSVSITSAIQTTG